MIGTVILFEPERWPGREWIARISGCAVIAVFLFRRFSQFPQFPGFIADVAWLKAWFEGLTFLPRPRSFQLDLFYRPLGYTLAQIRILWTGRFLVWFVESAIFVGYLVAFLTRDRAKSVARGFLETAFPLLMAGFPFAIVMTDYTFHRWVPARAGHHFAVLGSILALLFVGGAFNLYGLLTLRRSFTIASEARTLVTGGPYRFVRHPLYAAHFVVYLGYTLLHLHWYTVVLYALFVAGQTLRARIEERKLAAAFPEYEAYRRSTGMFFPRISTNVRTAPSN